MYTMPLDELNVLREELQRQYALGKIPEKRKVISDVEDVLIEAYLMGMKEAAYILGEAEEVDEDRMLESVYARTGGGEPTPNQPYRSRVATVSEMEQVDVGGTGNPLNFAERLEEKDSVEDIMRVAETEAHRVFNDAEMDYAVTHGAKTKTWVTMGDDRVRDAHEYLDFVTVPIDEYFVTYDGAKAMRPGAFGIPEYDIGCRCVLSFGR